MVQRQKAKSDRIPRESGTATWIGRKTFSRWLLVKYKMKLASKGKVAAPIDAGKHFCPGVLKNNKGRSLLTIKRVESRSEKGPKGVRARSER